MKGFACIGSSNKVEMGFNITPVVFVIESHAVNSVLHTPLVVSDPIAHDFAGRGPLLNQKVEAIFLNGQNIEFPPKPVRAVDGFFDKLRNHSPLLPDTLKFLEVRRIFMFEEHMFEGCAQIPIDGFYEEKLKRVFHVDQLLPMIEDELETVEFRVIMVGEYEKYQRRQPL